ncbi:MAG: hypothetical protein QNJ63_13570 [Calothrix sp. MO_192.B10]|nr:hypothetical protein [Calothrix sp. MO_192.B10]
MLDVPTPIINYLLNLMIEKHSLAYLLVNKDGCLSQWGGKLAAYGIEQLQEGEKVEKQVFFLEGMLPLNDDPIFIPRMKTEYGICADIHIFPSKDGDWVLFLDATLEEMQLCMIQQSINESILMQDKVTKIFNQ